MATIVTISRQFGCGGAWVGRALAQQLGFQYADREILAAAAQELKVHPAVIEEMEERVSSIWGRIGQLFALGAPDTPFIPPTLPSVSESKLFEVQKQIIKSLAAHGNAVIVGRGAPHIIGNSADVLRVFLHAPLQDRVTLAMTEYGFTDRAEAEAVVRESDAARANFVKTLTRKHWCDASLYHVALDTSVVGLERTVEILVDLVKRSPTTPLPPMMPRTAADRDPK